MAVETPETVRSYEDIEVEASRGSSSSSSSSSITTTDCGDCGGDDSQQGEEIGVTWDESVLTIEMGKEDETSSLSFSREPRKYETYDLKVDPNQDDRAAEIKLFSFKRPHMRAFHYAWWSYHVAFLMWFSISPLLSEVQTSLDLTKEQIWTSSITAVAGTIVMRFALGPFCDKYGPRIPMGVILFCAAIPTGMIGLTNSATGLAVVRFFIGIGGSTFVMAQYWASTMFTKEWVGTANAMVGGWGNVGGGVTQILMGSILFPLFRNLYDGDADKAWRTICIFPATIGLITAYCVVKYTDDHPKGNYSKMKKQNTMKTVGMLESFRKGAFNMNTWLLFVQYGCCFGVEITMNNAAALYFRDEFGLSTESAAAIASIFGWMNLFARGMGGYVSDRMNRRFGMRGRLAWQTFVLFMEGFMVIVFAYCKNLGLAIAILVFFSIFVQAAEGSSYGIVPYVNPPFTGSISGIIGAGGNTGAVVFGLFFQQFSAQKAFIVMGFSILLSSVLSIFVFIKGQPGLIWRTTVGEQPAGQTLALEQKESPDVNISMSGEDTSSSCSGSHQSRQTESTL